MKYYLTLALTGAMMGLTPNPASAWNSIGHLAVAKLAYDRLDDAHKTRLFTLLKRHPHFESFLAAGQPAEVSEVEWVVLRAAVWPDWVRPRDKDTRGADVTRYHRGEDHYINIPLIDPADAEAFAGKTLINPDLTNILCALKQRANELQTKTADDADKAVAVCWLFHLVGDIHQPLHNVAYFSRTWPKGDLGGNRFGVRVNGRKWKLHAYWDDLLGEDADYTDDSPKRQANLFKQAVTLAESLRGLTLSGGDNDRLAKNLTFASWSEESFELAKTVAYQKTDGGGILEGVDVPFKGPIPDAAKEVGPKYAATARAVAEIRVVLAGRRLAERMKMLLSK